MGSEPEAEKLPGKSWRLLILAVGLIVVFVLVGMLGNATGSFIGGDFLSSKFLGPASHTSARGHIEQIKTMLLMYQAQNGFYPTTEQGLKALIRKPTTEPAPPHWRQLLDKPLFDPWRRPFRYEQPGRHNPTSYDIYSAGPDGLARTIDDIGNWDAK